MAEVDPRDVAAFVQVVEAGGFTAAAAAHHLPKSSVSRAVSRLEAALGVRLLHRTTRSLALTEAGRAYHGRVAAALSLLAEAAADAASTQDRPRGHVRLVAPPDVGAELLPGLLAGFVAQHPEVTVYVDLTPGEPPLVEGGYDLGLRAGRPSEASVVSVRLQEIPFRLYAAPSYLDSAGDPQGPRDLEHHRCVVFRPRTGRARWRLVGPDGEVDVVVRGAVMANDMTFVRRAAIAGAGIALLPELVGERAVDTGRLRSVLPQLAADGIPLYLVTPGTTYIPAHVRAVRDFLVGTFPQARRMG